MTTPNHTTTQHTTDQHTTVQHGPDLSWIEQLRALERAADQAARAFDDLPAEDRGVQGAWDLTEELLTTVEYIARGVRESHNRRHLSHVTFHLEAAVHVDPYIGKYVDVLIADAKALMLDTTHDDITALQDKLRDAVTDTFDDAVARRFEYCIRHLNHLETNR